MKKHLRIPKFKTEDAERAFWSKTDLTTLIGEGKLVPVAFPNLKPSSQSISLRLPESLLVRIKEQAHELNVPYQSLIKQYIAKGVRQRMGVEGD